MQTTLQLNGQTYSTDLQQPLDIAIPLKAGLETVNCFYAPPMEHSPVVAGDFIGSTQEGGPVNFLTVRLTPHGNGTHTECVGHIAKETYTINQCLQQFHFPGQLISVFPTKTDEGDRVIYREQLEALLGAHPPTTALIIRTLPNDDLKMITNYSGANPPYLHHEAISYLVERGVEHLLLDLPSVDREEDGGQLLGHRAFWQYPEAPRAHCTITELIYVNNSIRDGLYLLNLQVASFEIDASPSKPVLYALERFE
ncbi:cyclase family protein [Phaeodactylibacter xiamenensis]|jgi:kynurenine formamidase|uniref:Metal-dependent hydrolase n=1 Tax=Phaeodactylibacter xiamenensis TaxID=1524460 RepID=A0A098S8Q6_9BACT|nr:cyclase family protein [Phaeodactylibacter xiamenensis]KGE88919.1 metal-dependent hydrolase [Phaeodactylibacter xiamenensis]MCR9052673.1 cyclase family protein [bacterium]